PGLGRPDRLEAEPLRLLDQIDVQRELGPGVAHHQTETHACSLRSPSLEKSGPRSRRRVYATNGTCSTPFMLERAEGMRGDLELGTIPRLVRGAADRFAPLAAVV